LTEPYTDIDLTECRRSSLTQEIDPISSMGGKYWRDQSRAIEHADWTDATISAATATRSSHWGQEFPEKINSCKACMAQLWALHPRKPVAASAPEARMFVVIILGRSLVPAPGCNSSLP